MKKIICYLLIPVLFIINILLFINIDFKNIIKKEVISNFINKVSIIDIISNDKNEFDYNKDKYNVILQKVSYSSIISILYDDYPTYNEKDILNFVDDMMPSDIDKASPEYELIRNELYKECSDLLNKFPNRNNINDEEKSTIFLIKYIFSNSFKKVLIIMDMFIIGIMACLTFSDLLFLKYNGVVMLITGAISVLFKGIMYYIFYYFRDIKIYGNLFKEFLTYIYNNMIASSVIILVLGLVQLILYFSFNKNKTQ